MECCKQSLVGHSCRSLKYISIENNVDSGNLAQEFQNENNISKCSRDNSLDTLAKKKNGFILTMSYEFT